MPTLSIYFVSKRKLADNCMIAYLETEIKNMYIIGTLFRYLVFNLNFHIGGKTKDVHFPVSNIAQK